MDTRIDVVYKDGSSEPYLAVGESFIIGRSLEAAVSIPDARELEPEHLRITPELDGCQVAINPQAAVQASVSGSPLRDGLYEWGTEIEIGELVIVLTGDDPNKKKANIGPIVAAFLILAIGFAFYIYQRTRDPLADLRAPTAFPAIIPTEKEQCEGPKETSNEDAIDALNTADAKSDRYAFDPQDGIEAIRLYSKAVACGQRASNKELVAQAATSGKKLVDKVQTDYATHRVAMARAIEMEDHKAALYHTSVLIHLVQHTGSPYLQKLYGNAQKLKMQVAEDEKKNKVDKD